MLAYIRKVDCSVEIKREQLDTHLHSLHSSAATAEGCPKIHNLYVKQGKTLVGM